MELPILMDLLRSRIIHHLVTHGPTTATELSSALDTEEANISEELRILLSAECIVTSDTDAVNKSMTYKADQERIHLHLEAFGRALGVAL